MDGCRKSACVGEVGAAPSLWRVQGRIAPLRRRMCSWCRGDGWGWRCATSALPSSLERGEPRTMWSRCLAVSDSVMGSDTVSVCFGRLASRALVPVSVRMCMVSGPRSSVSLCMCSGSDTRARLLRVCAVIVALLCLRCSRYDASIDGSRVVASCISVCSELSLALSVV